MLIVLYAMAESSLDEMDWVLVEAPSQVLDLHMRRTGFIQIKDTPTVTCHSFAVATDTVQLG